MSKAEIEQHFRGDYRSFYGRYLDGFKPGIRDKEKLWCPFHQGNSPALSINFKTGLFYCHSCGAEGDAFSFYALKRGLSLPAEFQKTVAGIAADFGIGNGCGEAGKRIVAEYSYHDEGGWLAYQKIRYEPKSFRLRRPDGKGGWVWNLDGVRLVPYRLKDVQAAPEIIFVEGEKDADGLHRLGFAATCCPHGSGQCPEHFGPLFKGKAAVLIPDQDEPGRKHMAQVAASLKGNATSIRWVDLPAAKPGYDVSDFIAEDPETAVERLSWLMADAAEYKHPEPPPPDGIIFEPAARIEIEPVTWLWKNHLAEGKMHLVAGPPGTGKTTLALSMGSTISAGSAWPDGTRAKKGNVLLWTGEDSCRDTVVPRLLAMRADLDRFVIVRGKTKEGKRLAFDPATDLDALREAMATRHYDLFIVDPLVAVTSRDSHKNSETRKDLAPLVELGEACKTAIMGVHHFAKGTAGRDPLDRIIGSVAFAAVARLVFVAVKLPDEDDEGGRLFARAKSNIGPDGGGFKYQLQPVRLPGPVDIETVRIAWGERVDGDAASLVEMAEADEDKRSKFDQAKDWLADFIDKPTSAKRVYEAAKAAGFSKRTIQAAKQALKIEASRVGYGPDGGWQWTLAKGCKNSLL